jgi:hypothetical protein
MYFLSAEISLSRRLNEANCWLDFALLQEKVTFQQVQKRHLRST